MKPKSFDHCSTLFVDFATLQPKRGDYDKQESLTNDSVTAAAASLINARVANKKRAKAEAGKTQRLTPLNW